MRKISGTFFCVALAAVLVGGAGRADGPTPAERQVVILNFSFEPGTLTVPVGTTVTWVNRDNDAHSVQSKDKGFPSSRLLDTGQKYSYTFTTPGTYPYQCAVHAYMTGKIVVTPAN